ncbi:MAG: hypothetical protein LUF87_10880, partial [Alistipes sp.]|nr:hypothetical protein [Alistipes sp.]
GRSLISYLASLFPSRRLSAATTGLRSVSSAALCGLGCEERSDAAILIGSAMTEIASGYQPSQLRGYVRNDEKGKLSFGKDISPAPAIKRNSQFGLKQCLIKFRPGKISAVRGTNVK